MKTKVKKQETTVNKRTVNAQKNSSKLLETKCINLVNEAKKETKKQEQKNKANFKRVVIGTNNIFKTNFNSLCYLLKIVSNDEQLIFEEQKKNSDFNEFDQIKLTSIFNVIKLARKNSDLYKTIQGLKGVQTKSGNYCIFFLLRTINTNLVDLQKQIELQNW
jgi:hypothetical protein